MVGLINDNHMEYILGETRFYFAQCVFNVKVHYSAHDRIAKARSCKQWIAGAISVGTIVLLVFNIIAWECSCQTILSIVSFAGLVLTAASLSFEVFNRQDLTELMCCHKQAAQDYMSLRDQFMDLIRQIKEGGNLEDVSKQVQVCLRDYSKLGAYALPTTWKDYVSAQKKLGLYRNDEQFTWTSQQIDKFLPIELRENKNQERDEQGN